MGSRVRIRLFHILHFVMDFLFPLLKNSKSGVDDRGHRLRITHTHRRRSSDNIWAQEGRLFRQKVVIFPSFSSVMTIFLTNRTNFVY